MKLFFISPDERKNLANAGDRPPLGILLLATICKKYGHEVYCFDLNHSSNHELKCNIEVIKPDFLCYSFTSSPSYRDLHMIMLENKYLFPETKSIVGGYHVSVRPQDFMDADFIVKNNGEFELLKILGHDFVVTNENYEIIPFADRTLLNHDYNLIQNGKKTATIMTSKGCPYDCLFCGNQNKKVTYRNIENIKSELKHLKDLGYEALYVLDDAFTVSKKHFFEVADAIKEAGFEYRCTTRSNLVNDETAKKLASTGCKIVSLGIESANDKTLEIVNKREKVEAHEKAIKTLYKYGIDVKGFFIVGLPGESIRDVRNTIRWACRMKKKGLVSADFYALCPFPGSRLYDNPGAYGIKILSDDWDDYLQAGKELVNPIIETDKLKRGDIQDLLQEAKDEFAKS